MESAQTQPNQPVDQPSASTPPAVVRQKGRKSLSALSLIVVVVVLILMVAFALHHKKHTQQTVPAATSTVPATQVTITANGFSPATISIKKGQTVTWLNKDTNPHQPVTDPYPEENGLPGFADEGALTTGETYGYKFNKTGTFTYHDHLNPYRLKGTVIVK